MSDDYADEGVANELKPFLQAVMKEKIENLTVLDVRPLTSVADVFILTSGRSNRQVCAISENVEVALKKKGVKPLGIEGKKEGHWILMDYGHVLIHVFYEPVREFYDLEGLWADAKRLDPEAIAET